MYSYTTPKPEQTAFNILPVPRPEVLGFNTAHIAEKLNIVWNFEIISGITLWRGLE